MGFLKFVWDFAWQVSFNAYGFVGIVGAIIPHIIKFFDQRYSTHRWWGWVRMKNIIHRVPTSLFIVLIIGSVLFASYQTYQEQQTQVTQLNKDLSKAKETFRPMLYITNTKIEDGSVKVDPDNNGVFFTLDYTLNNQGFKPAYNVQMQGFSAPQNDPSKIVIMPPKSQPNAINSGEAIFKFQQNYLGYYSRQGDVGRVIIYVLLKYSDASINGTTYQEPYWWSFRINPDQTCSVEPVDPSWTIPFITYAANISSGKIP